MAVCTQPQLGHLSVSLLTSLTEHYGRGIRKSIETGRWGGVYSRHDTVIALVNSEQLWLLRQDLQEIKPARIPSWLGRSSRGPTLAEEVPDIEDCRGGKPFFIRAVLESGGGPA